MKWRSFERKLKVIILLFIIQSYLCVFNHVSAQETVTLQYDVAGTRSFNLPNGVTSITAEGWGGGGGGGYSDIHGQTTGGGGGSAYTKNIRSIHLTGGNRALHLTVGVGGSGGSGKNNGSASIVDLSGTRLLNAVGGEGVDDNSTSGGVGGQSSNCTPASNAFSGGNGGNGNGKGGSNNSSGGGGGAAGTNRSGGKGGSGGSSDDSSGGFGGIAGAGGGNGGTGSEGKLSGSGPGNSGEDPGGGGGGGKRPNSIFTTITHQPGGNGGTGRIILSLTISPPSITSNGNCYSPNRGLTLTSSYTSTTVQGVSYQWKKDGDDILGATSASLNITDAGNYSLSVSYSFTNSVYGATAKTVHVTSIATQVYLAPTATLSPDNISICEGESAELVMATTGKAPWSITYNDGSANYSLSGISTTPYIFPVSPAKTTSYTLVNVSDSNCTTGDVSGKSTVTVCPFPQKSVIYRLPNN